MTDTRTENDHLEVLLGPENAGAGHGPWETEPKARMNGVWLTDDDGCSLLVTASEVAALVNYVRRRREYVR